MKERKGIHKIFLSVCLLCLIITISGCEEQMNNNTNNENLTVEIPAFNLPENYHIEMTVTDKGKINNTQKYSMLECDEGVYIYVGDTKTHYIFERLENGKYIQYQKNRGSRKYVTPTIPDSLWKQIKAGNVSLDSVSTDENMINGVSTVFTGNFNSYESVSSTLKYEGKETISGYTCLKFVSDINHISGRTKTEYWIEPETGLCMKMFQHYKSLLYENKRTVEITVFETGSLTLPEH